ncbi:TPA: hypothetical protein ACH3X1_008253 [Trebouxia sp. C0004]
MMKAESDALIEKDLEDCKFRRAALQVQAELHSTLMIAEAHSVVASKVHKEQTEQLVQPTDHKHNAGELVWYGYGSVRDMVEEAAELQGFLEGLRKAKDHNIAHLVLCAKVSLLKQILDQQAAQSSRHAEHLSLVHDAMTFCQVQGDAISTADIQKLTELFLAQSKAQARPPAIKGPTETMEATTQEESKSEGGGGFICDICMDSVAVESMHAIAGCFHEYCKGCLEQQILASRVDDGDALLLAKEKGWKRCPACRCDLFDVGDALNDQEGQRIAAQPGQNVAGPAGRRYAAQLAVARARTQARLDAMVEARRYGGNRAERYPWPDPQRYKTELCYNWPGGNCQYGAECHFAHGQGELYM